MSTDELLAEALRLTRVDRARVAEGLLSSLEESDEEVATASAAELERRSRDVAAGRPRPAAGGALLAGAGPCVAASLFVKRYSFAVLIALYSMSVMNKRIDFSVDNLSIQTFDETDLIWLPFIKFDRLSFIAAPKEDRVHWRNETLAKIFANHIEVLFDSLTKVTKISKRIMWENLYTYIVWMYTNLLANKAYEHQHAMILDDFNWMTAVGEGNLFGNYFESPFLNYRSTKDSLSILDGTPHKRTTCCLSYLTESKGSFCKNCPIERKRKQV